MRLFRTFVGDRVIFPFQDVVGEGTLWAVERTGWMLILDAEIEGKPAGDIVISPPAWLRRAVTNG